MAMSNIPNYNEPEDPKIAELKQRKAANAARIAELQNELQGVTTASQKNLTDADILDLELAANRARAYDMGGATSALSRMGSRAVNRETARLNEIKAKQLKDSENKIKLAELQDKHRQLGIDLTQAKTPAIAAQIRSQMQNVATQINSLGGQADGYDAPITSYAEVMEDYWAYTKNTKGGRKFADFVDPEGRYAMVKGLRDVGEYEKADALEAMPTKGEKDEAAKKGSAKRKSLQKAAKEITKKITEIRSKKMDEWTITDMNTLRTYEDMADSLARNYGDYIKLENKLPKYIGKD